MSELRLDLGGEVVFLSAELDMENPLLGGAGEQDTRFYVDVSTLSPEQLALLKGERGQTGPIGPMGIQGPDGPIGPSGPQGLQGEPFVYEDFTTVQLAALTGPKGDSGEKGDTGEAGPSAFHVAIANGFLGSELDWLDSLKGIQGDKGDPGEVGEIGPHGMTAYESALLGGFQGLETEFYAALSSIGDVAAVLDLVNGEIV